MWKLAWSTLAFVLIATVSRVSAGPDQTAAPSQAPVKNIVLVHGAWANSSSWDKVIPLLQAKGFNVVATSQPLSGLSDDVAVLKRVIDAQTGPVILVGHSYGGAIITAAGIGDKVVGLVYVDGFALDEGETINGLLKAGPPPEWLPKLQVNGGFISLPAEVMDKDFAQDLPAATRKLMTVTQGPFAAKALDDRMTTPAWKSKPSWYVRGEIDRIIPPAAQEQMAKRAGAKMTSVNASHVSMIAKPAAVAQVIMDAANDAMKAHKPSS